MHRFKITIWKYPGKSAWDRGICEESMSVNVEEIRSAYYYCTHDGGRERNSGFFPAEKAVFFNFWLVEVLSLSSNEMKDLLTMVPVP